MKMRHIYLAWTLLMVLHSQGYAGSEQPWDDAVLLDNGYVQCRISPAIGRVVWFGLPGETNMIWINPHWQDQNHATMKDGQSYVNYGGDKVWVYPQELWEDATGHKLWPPDGTIDGKPWSIVKQDKTALVMQSQHSDVFGINVQRTFTLTPDRPEMIIDNVIRRDQSNPLPVMIWSVTQIVTPKAVLLDLDAKRTRQMADFRIMDESSYVDVKSLIQRLGGENGCVKLNLDQTEFSKLKIGTFGSWIAAIYDDCIFVELTKLQTDAAYPKVSNMQFYQHSQGEYAELETLSPMNMLSVGGELQCQVIWQIRKKYESDTINYHFDEDDNMKK